METQLWIEEQQQQLTGTAPANVKRGLNWNKLRHLERSEPERFDKMMEEMVPPPQEPDDGDEEQEETT